MATCSFDIETDGVDNPAITCAATIVTNHDTGATHTRTWHSKLGELMSERRIAEMVQYLYSLHVAGVRLVTFNGASFDFRVVHNNLPPESESLRCRVREMAMDHVDIMYAFVCDNGHFASMQSFSEATGASKTGKGSDAIDNWLGDGATAETQRGVLDYCRNDVVCLEKLYKRVTESDSINRVTKSGKTQVWNHGRLTTVAECVARFNSNPPDNAWMRNPPDPNTMIEWAAQ